MSMHHPEWTDRFAGYMSGELDESERAAIEAHLASCGECRRVLAELREIVSAAAELPELEPPRDLWPGIAARIREQAAPSSERPAGDVIALPTARPAASRPAVRGWRYGGAGLAAAAAGLVAVSVGVGWWAGTSRVAPLVDEGASAPGDVLSVSAPGAAAPPASLADDLAALEGVLDSARDVLDPATVLVLERNLDLIERAIADSRRALEVEPNNAFLTEHLERMYRRKLLYLQDVVRVVEWAG